MLGMVYGFLTFALARIHEVLVDGEHDEIQAGFPRPTLEAIHVFRRFPLHLPVKDLDAVETEFRCMVDDLFDGVLRFGKVPVGIGRDTQPNAPARLSRIFFRTRGGT